MCIQVMLTIESEDALFKLFVLLYADDTIILAENQRDLQTYLDSVYEYCTKHKLIVNTNKTKICETCSHHYIRIYMQILYYV